MTREEAKLMLPIITAFANGETIEVLKDVGLWREEDQLLFNLNPIKYRIVKPKYRTIEDGLVVGDIVIDKYSNERRVLAIFTCIIFLSDYGNHDHCNSPYTLQELINDNFTLKQEEVKEEIQSFTLKQVSNGEANGIPSHLIRIKE